MKINFNKEQLVGIGKAGLKVGKAIVIEGTKAVIVKSVTSVVMEGFDNGTEGIKSLTLDKVIGKKKSEVKSEDKVEKKSFFKRKEKKVEMDEGELAETISEIVTEAYEAGVEDGLTVGESEA